jgi:hypothetical protein
MAPSGFGGGGYTSTVREVLAAAVVPEKAAETRIVEEVAALGGAIRYLGAPTINVKSVDGGPPDRCCQRSRRAHHQCKKHRR